MKRNKHLIVKGKLKDRGRIKWTAMMLPEHVQMLREWQQEDRYHVKPELDEFDLEAIHEEIRLAELRHCEIELHLWRDGSHVRTGTIGKIDLAAQQLLLQTGAGTERVAFSDIIGAKTHE